MKIVHVCQYYNDDWGYQENLLAEYQKKLGHNIVVITSDRKSKNFIDKYQRVVGVGSFIKNGIRIERIPIKFEFLGRFVIFKDLNSVLEKENPDFIFHHGLTSPSLKTVVNFKTLNKNVFLAVDNHSEYSNSGRIWIWRFLYYRFFWKKVLSYNISGIDRFFSITPICKLFAEKELGVPSANHELLYLGSDVDNIYFDSEYRKKVRDYYGFNESDIVIITAGKIDENKKVDVIIRAVKEIRVSNLKLIIIGPIEKKYANRLEKLINNDKNIVKTGWIEKNELFKYLSASDIAVFPGSQSVLWQYAVSCELPLILRYWTGTEYLLLQENGMFLFSDDYKELMQHLNLLLKNPELIKKMKVGAKQERDDILSYYNIARKSLKVES